MAANGGVGIELDLDLIPEREPGMVPYEYLLSESQERMLFVAHAGREQELIEIFHRWGLQAVVAGSVIEEPIVRILFEGGVAAEVPATALSDNTPIYHHELMTEPPEYARTAWAWQESTLPPATTAGIDGQSWGQVIVAMLSSPTIASKRWVYRQYDHQVQNNTVVMPGGADAAVIRLRFPSGETRPAQANPAANANAGLAATVDCNARYVYLNPYEGALAAVAEAARNLSCVGAEPIAVTDNLNFGSPEKPIGYWQLAEACRGLAEGCRKFSTPVTGGNVSLYNETLDSNGKPQPIYPTPVVGMVGLIPDLAKVCGQAWQAEGDLIYLLGVSTDSIGDRAVTLGGSEYLKRIHGIVAGQPPKIDVALELAVQTACREGIRQGLIRSAHDCSEGGLAIALAECCISGEKGASLTLPQGQIRLDTLLFGEGGARIVVSVSPEHQSDWEAHCQKYLPDVRQIGVVAAEDAPMTVSSPSHGLLFSLDVSHLSDQWG